MANNVVIKAEKVCFSHYKQPLCIKDFDIEICENEKVLVLAVDGQGKTTLLNVLSGFDTNYIGRIFHFGDELKKISNEKRRVSLLPCEPVLLNSTIRKNIDFLAEIVGIKKLSKDELELKLTEFLIERTEDEKIKKLSSFEKRKLAFLRTSLKNGRAVFVDDQFKNLELKESQELYGLIEKVSENKIAVIASDEKSFKENYKFFKDFKFSKVVFLSFADSFVFDSIEDFENAVINFDAKKFSHETLVYDGYIVRKNDNYFWTENGELLFKLSNEFLSRLDSLKIDNGENEKVCLCTKETVVFSEIKNEEFNKKLKKGEFLIFSALTGEYVV